MSWWDTAGISNLANQALATAQKQIDKALDIKEEEAARRRKEAAAAALLKKKGKDKTEKEEAEPEDGENVSDNKGNDSWSSWMGVVGEKPSEEKSEPGDDAHSSWGLPSWGGLSTPGKESNRRAEFKAKLVSSSQKKSPLTAKPLSRKNSSNEISDSKKQTLQDPPDSKEKDIVKEVSASLDKGWQDFSVDNTQLEKDLGKQKDSLVTDNSSTINVQNENKSEAIIPSVEVSKNIIDDLSASSQFSSEGVNATVVPSDKNEESLLDSGLQRTSTTSSFADVGDDNRSESAVSESGSTKPASISDYCAGEAKSDDSNNEQSVNSQEISLDQNYFSQSSQDATNINPDNIASMSQTASMMENSGLATSSDLDFTGGRTSSTGSSDTSKFDSSIDTVVDRLAMDDQNDRDIIDADSSYTLFDTENKMSGAELQTKTSEEEKTSLDTSYVKCLLEEAMDDAKTDSSSDNHSNGEKSEGYKVDSEFEKSIYESSDDIETTTSSDIEILQAPSTSEESKYYTSFDVSPLKLALQKTAKGQGHQKTAKGQGHQDSQSSSSASKEESASPERGDGSLWRDEVKEEGEDSPYHPERLLKQLCEGTLQQGAVEGQKMAEMAEVLQARESKLIDLSKANHELMEEASILRSQLQQSEEAREVETADVNVLTNEFTARLGDSEKKIQGLHKEKETLSKKLARAESDLISRSENEDIEALLQEKTEAVEQLLEEGQKLSKQQLQSNNIIKKLRTKEKETDLTSTTQKKKVEEQTKELERLAVVLESKEEMESKQAEAITQLNAAVQTQEKELVRFRGDQEDGSEKVRGLQTALDNSYKEIAELHRSNASQDSKAQEAALSAETKVREELKSQMERENQRFRQEREAFIIQADDLRLDQVRLEREHSRREESLRQEISHLQQRLQEDESRSQELTHTVSSATRPLLRQIENLQTTHGVQTQAWEKVEKSLTDRLCEAQTAVAMAQEKERCWSEKHMDLSARVTGLEMSNTRLKTEKATLAAQGETDRIRLEDMEDTRHSVLAQVEASKARIHEELQQLKVDKVHLESQLGVERHHLDTEAKKSLALEEQLRFLESQSRPRSRGSPSPSPSMSVSRQESLLHTSGHESLGGSSSPGWAWGSLHEDIENGGAGRASIYDSLRHSGSTIVMENVQSQLKLREGEITQLRSEIGSLERTRESMARELVNLSNHNDDLMETKEEFEVLKKQYQELNVRYNSLLQMYGEKEEQVQELRLDLEDVKGMYRAQIDTLLAK